MIRYLPFVLVFFLVVAALVTWVLSRSSARPVTPEINSEIERIAYSHREIDEGPLANAVISRVLEAKRSLKDSAAEQLADDVLELAHEHRAVSPQLSAILTDTILSKRYPKELE